MSPKAAASLESRSPNPSPPRLKAKASSDWGWDTMFPLPQKLPPPRSPYQDGRLGWRTYSYLDENGAKQYDEIGLTPEDLVDPWPGDRPVLSWNHNVDIQRIRGTLVRWIPPDWRGVRIACDNKFLFEDENVPKNPGPDVAVLVDAPDDVSVLNSFRIRTLGVRIVAIFEVVSPEDKKVRVNDLVIKKDIYESAGVPLYVIVDVPEYRLKSKRKAEKRRIQIIAYEFDEEGRYRELPRDERGRVFLAPLNLWIGKESVGPDVEQVAFFDPATGEQLENPDEFLQTADREIHEAKQTAKAAEEKTKAAEQTAKAAEQTAKAAEEKTREAEREAAKAKREAKEKADAFEELRKEFDRKLKEELSRIRGLS